MKLLFSNIWLFKPLLLAALPLVSAQAGAMLRTTAAFTMMSGSDACNVLPQEATVWANMRFIPHEGMEKSLAKVKRISEKYGLKMEAYHASDATRSVDIHGEGFHLAAGVIEETFPGVPVCPYVMTGATDARFYERVADNVVRFAPVIYGPEQMKGMHGLNENIEYNCLPGCVDFYKNLILAMGESQRPEDNR